MPPSKLDLFSGQAALYAKFRPTYPKELFDFLAGLTPQHERAWDVGTGSGQAAVELAARYESVIATDLSEGQIAHATRMPNVTYKVTPPVLTPEEVSAIVGPPGSVDLITVAQALHWFDFGNFYAAARTVLRRPGGVIAAWCYGICCITPEMDEVVAKFYERTLPYWEPQRAYIEQEYRTIPFDFDPPPGRGDTGPVRFETTREYSLEDFLGYLSSWSPVQTAKEKGIALLDDPLRSATAAAWGLADGAPRAVTWPVFIRVGAVNS